MTLPAWFRTVLRVLLILALGLGVTACADTQSPTEPPSPTAATIPTDWPRAVPLYQGGTLFTAFVNPDGTAGALWEVEGVKESAVASEYGRALRKAGFRRVEWYSNFAETGFFYSGHGLRVAAGTLESEGTTSLNVSVECPAGCEDPPQAGG